MERRREVEGGGCRVDSSGTRSSVRMTAEHGGHDKKTQRSDFSPILRLVMVQHLDVLFYNAKPTIGHGYAWC